MTHVDLVALAKAVHDGTASEQEKLNFLQALNIELAELSLMIKAAKDVHQSEI